MTETNQEATIPSPSLDFSETDQIALIERVVASSHFRRATRLCEFLLFVGRSALNRNNGSAGDFIVAQRILALDHSTKGLKLTFAREYSSEAIKLEIAALH